MHSNSQPIATETDSAATTGHERVLLTSTVLGVVLRVAGPVQTGITVHELDRWRRAINVRIGDAVVYLADPYVAATLRQRWDASLGSAMWLRERVSQTWLRPRPGTYPAAVSLQLTDQVQVSHRFVPADLARHAPGMLEVRIDQLVWQVCDQLAWRTIGDAWLAAHEQIRG